MKEIINVSFNNISIISILEGLNVEFDRLRVYTDNDAGGCRRYSGKGYGSTQGKI